MLQTNSNRDLVPLLSKTSLASTVDSLSRSSSFSLVKRLEISSWKMNHSSMGLALMRLAQMVKELPCHRLLTFAVKQRTSCDRLLQIGATQMRLALEKVVKIHIQSHISETIGKTNKFQMLQETSNSQTFINLSEINQEMRLQFNTILVDCLQILQKQYPNKEIYGNLVISWKEEIIEDLGQQVAQKKDLNNEDTETLISKLKSIDHKLAQKTKSAAQKLQERKKKLHDRFTVSKNPGENNPENEFRKYLGKLTGSLVAKQQLLKLFLKCQEDLGLKETELANWLRCSQDMQSVIVQQMEIISYQTNEQQNLKEEMIFMRDQLALAEDRCFNMENDISIMAKELADLKSWTPPVQEKSTYYINPHFEKTQMEEKLYIEIIELESDLLVGKTQIKAMTEAIIEIFKVTHNAFEDLQASKFFVRTIDKSYARIIKDLQAFDSIDMQQILTLKEDTHSIEDSDFMTQMGKSGISTFSELDISQRNSRINEGWVEDDTLGSFHSEQ